MNSHDHTRLYQRSRQDIRWMVSFSELINTSFVKWMVSFVELINICCLCLLAYVRDKYLLCVREPYEMITVLFIFSVANTEETEDVALLSVCSTSVHNLQPTSTDEVEVKREEIFFLNRGFCCT